MTCKEDTRNPLSIFPRERSCEAAGVRIIDAVSKKYVSKWGNEKKYIAIHYLGVVGENHELASVLS